MDNCLLRIPRKHLNCETVSLTRLIFLLFVTFHRLYQIFSCKEDLDKYPSLYHYRNAANHRRTFHESLLNCAKVFRKEVEKFEEEENNETHPAVVSPTTTSQPITSENITTRVRRTIPSCRPVDGVRPERIDFGAVLTTRTPSRLNRIIQNGEGPSAIREMIYECTGNPVKSHPIKQQQCCVCKLKTSYYCVGCKRWFCVERRDTNENSKKLKLYTHLIKGKTVTFQKLCFHFAHEAAWRRKNQEQQETSSTA